MISTGARRPRRCASGSTVSTTISISAGTTPTNCAMPSRNMSNVGVGPVAASDAAGSPRGGQVRASDSGAAAEESRYSRVGRGKRLRAVRTWSYPRERHRGVRRGATNTGEARADAEHHQAWPKGCRRVADWTCARVGSLCPHRTPPQSVRHGRRASPHGDGDRVRVRHTQDGRGVGPQFRYPVVHTEPGRRWQRRRELALVLHATGGLLAHAGGELDRAAFARIAGRGAPRSANTTPPSSLPLPAPHAHARRPLIRCASLSVRRSALSRVCTTDIQHRVAVRRVQWITRYRRIPRADSRGSTRFRGPYRSASVGRPRREQRPYRGDRCVHPRR